MARITMEDLTDKQKFKMLELKSKYKCATWKDFVKVIIEKLE